MCDVQEGFGVIESMCVVCHGPVHRNRWGRTGITCNPNCHGVWFHHLKRGGKLNPKYLVIRASNAYRRELEAQLRIIERRVVLRRAC